MCKFRYSRKCSSGRIFQSRTRIGNLVRKLNFCSFATLSLWSNEISCLVATTAKITSTRATRSCTHGKFFESCLRMPTVKIFCVTWECKQQNRNLFDLHLIDIPNFRVICRPVLHRGVTYNCRVIFYNK